MITVEFEPRDIIKLELAMKQLDAKVLLMDEWGPFLKKFVKVASEYAPDFPGNTYTRTGHLGESWIDQVLDPLTAQVMNLAIYAGWVVGHEQTALHAGHKWKYAFDVARDHLDYLVQDLWEKVEQIWTA